MRKKLFFLFLVLMIGGYGFKENKENLDCGKNWAICMVIPLEIEQPTSKNPVKVAILDSGISRSIPQLETRIVKSFNAIENSSEVNPLNDHGTMIASIIAFTSYKKNAIGINNQIELYDVQVLDETGSGIIEHTISGINWAIEEKVDIITMSYGFSKDNPLFHEVIRAAQEEGILLVAASGNTIGLSTDYPAKYKEVLSISAIDDQKEIFLYAGKGKVDYVAPGVNVPVLNIKGEIGYETGTSFATAYATGIISLLKTKMRNEEIIEYLNINSIKLGATSTYGKGLIQYKEEK